MLGGMRGGLGREEGCDNPLPRTPISERKGKVPDVNLKRFAHSAEPNYLKLFLRSYCRAALLACMLKKLKNCSKVDPKLSPEGPKMTRKLSQNEEKKESGSQNYPREVPGEI